MNELATKGRKFNLSVTATWAVHDQKCAKDIFSNRRNFAPVNDFYSHREFLFQDQEFPVRATARGESGVLGTGPKGSVPSHSA